jgi:arylsulfatase A-like enzyme
LPALSVLWLSEPDYAQHGVGPGAGPAREGLKSSDDCLGKVLAALDAMKVREQTDVIVVSDHGFSTVAGGIEVMEELHKKGFDIGGLFLEKPEKGSIVMVGLAASIAFYVVDHDPDVTQRLVKHLQGSLYAGVLFTRDGLPGTFRLSDVGLDSAGSADVVMSMRWSGETPQREGGMPGAVLVEGKGYKPGQGAHGSLSRFEMHNTLVAAGPDFKSNFRSPTPSGNIDVAPTVLNILGITPKEAMDGRVLEEALAASTGAAPKAETKVMETKADVAGRVWRQYLKVSTVGKTRYYDEGNAGVPEGR